MASIEIPLAATLTAQYAEDFFTEDRDMPGRVEVYFGEALVGSMPVNAEQHRRLTGGWYPGVDRDRDRVVQEIVAAYLNRVLFS